MQNNKQARLFFFMLLLLAAVSAYLLLRPFMQLLILSFVIALIYRPVYLFIKKRLHAKESISAYITLLLIFLTAVLPILAIFTVVTTQFLSIANDIRSSGTITSESFSLEVIADQINSVAANFPQLEYQVTTQQLSSSLKELIEPVSGIALNNVVSLGGNALNAFTGIIIFSTVVITVLLNYNRLIQVIHQLSPLPNEVDKRYLDRLGSMGTSMVKGTFLVALAQGLATGIFLWIAGINYIALWVLISIILSVLPLGAGFLVLPLGIVQIISGQVWQGIFLIVTYLLITGNIDNVMRPLLVPKEASLHPALTVLGLFAGLKAFGFLGVILGPMLMIFISTTLEVYVEYYKEKSVTPKITQ